MKALMFCTFYRYSACTVKPLRLVSSVLTQISFLIRFMRLPDLARHWCWGGILLTGLAKPKQIIPLHFCGASSSSRICICAELWLNECLAFEWAASFVLPLLLFTHKHEGVSLSMKWAFQWRGFSWDNPPIQEPALWRSPSDCLTKQRTGKGLCCPYPPFRSIALSSALMNPVRGVGNAVLVSNAANAVRTGNFWIFTLLLCAVQMHARKKINKILQHLT